MQEVGFDEIVHGVVALVLQQQQQPRGLWGSRQSPTQMSEQAMPYPTDRPTDRPAGTQGEIGHWRLTHLQAAVARRQAGQVPPLLCEHVQQGLGGHLLVHRLRQRGRQAAAAVPWRGQGEGHKSQKLRSH